jgi:SHS2 domain-containing protein
MSYRFLEHTSDIIIEAEGKDFADALCEVAKGMFTQMGESGTKDSIIIESSASTKEGLAVVFLTDIIVECESYPFVPSDIRLIESVDNRIKCEILGEKSAPENIIKAVTHHELEIEDAQDNCRIKVLFDI